MGAKSPLRSVVLVAAAVAAGSLVLAFTFGSVLRWDVPGFVWEGNRGDGSGVPVDEVQSVPAQGIGRISVRAVSEKTVISAGAGDSFEIRLHGSVYPAAEGILPRLSVHSDQGQITVVVDRGRVGGIGWFWENLTLEVAVPDGFAGSLSATTVSGALEVAGRAYEEIALSTTSGAIRAGAMKARKLAMGTTSGRLRVSAAEAESVRFTSTSGSLEAGGLTGDVRATSVSGKISLDFAASPSSVEAINTSGAVALRLPADARFALDAHSTSGGIECAFPLTVMGRTAGRHELSGTVNGGTQPVKVHTVSGSIRIQR